MSCLDPLRSLRKEFNKAENIGQLVQRIFQEFRKNEAKRQRLAMEGGLAVKCFQAACDRRAIIFSVMDLGSFP